MRGRECGESRSGSWTRSEERVVYVVKHVHHHLLGLMDKHNVVRPPREHAARGIDLRIRYKKPIFHTENERANLLASIVA